MQFYASLPLKSLSRLWGGINNVAIPHNLRSPLFRLYAKIFGCDLSEMEEQDLTKFEHLGDFFYRSLKPDARPIDLLNDLVSPADGKVLHLGKVQDRRIEQVKGVTYSLPALLGKSEYNNSRNNQVSNSKTGSQEVADHPRYKETPSDAEFAQINTVDYSLDRIMGNSNGTHDYGHEKDKDLLFCVIYLAPGDYHRFHSPTEWRLEKQRHFQGELYSVSPWVVKKLRNLFVLNERVALLGHWKHGFFSMIPVGATNVGSIKVNYDDTLVTNKYRRKRGKYGEFEEKNLMVEVKRGEEMGGFRLGSTIVLVFEAPKQFEFKIQAGQKIKVGQSLGTVSD